MVQSITPADLKQMLDNQATCACIDVREAGEYNSAHIPGASLVPRRELEFHMPRLVPYPGTPVIVCDDEGRRASLAAVPSHAWAIARCTICAMAQWVGGWQHSSWNMARSG